MAFAIAAAVASIGSAAYGAYSSNKARKDAKRKAKAEQSQADRQLDMIEEQNQQQRDRYERNFRPIEDSIAAELQEGPDVEGAAQQAGGTFGTEFDAAQAGQERQLRQFGIRPDSQAYGRATEDAAFNRASGMSAAQNTARRAEEDSHFIQQLGFLQGGSGIQGEVARSMGDMYGIRSNNAAGYASDAATSAANTGRFANMGVQGIKDFGTAYGQANSGQNANNTAKKNGQYGQVASESPIREVNP